MDAATGIVRQADETAPSPYLSQHFRPITRRTIDIPLPHGQSHFSPITQRAISLQKVHLWMEISAGCPNRGRRSLTKMDRLRNVQSSVWTLQQILPDKLYHYSTFYYIITCRIKGIQKSAAHRLHLFLCDCLRK